MSEEARPAGTPQGGMLSEVGKAAYWRMQWESSIGALADLIAEHTETVTELADLKRAVSHTPDECAGVGQCEFHEMAETLAEAQARLAKVEVERDTAKAAIANLIRTLANDPREAIPRLDITTALFTPPTQEDPR